MKILVCIYTCKQDKAFLDSFKSSSLYAYLKSSNAFQILEVYADKDNTELHGDKLLLNCEENYSLLSIKTYEMIDRCVKHFDFDVLIKIDCNIFDHINANELLPPNIKCNLLNEQIITNIIKCLSSTSIYGGAIASFVDSVQCLKRWADIKNINLIETQLNSEFVYFAGKFYYLNRKMCEFISKYGKSDAELFAKNLGGAEDVYIGYMINKTKIDTLLILENHLQTTVKQITSNSLNEYQRKLLRKFKMFTQQKQHDTENCVDTFYADTAKINRCRLLKSNIDKLTSLL